MELKINPLKANWESLCVRPEFESLSLDNSVGKTLEYVKLDGDEALLNLTEKYDGISLQNLRVTEEEITAANALVSEELKQAINLAISNVKMFHQSQDKEEAVVTTSNGVNCWRKSIPIDKVGLYIPGGSAPLFSTIIMLAVPAKIAGCAEIILTTPPDKNGNINPVILYTASLLGVTKIFKVGGAQAIAAMAHGTESIPNVYKIFGPGNQYVTRAKEMVQQEGVAIDMPAGPSEVLIIADKTSNPEFVAADLLSQAEHGEDSQVILLSSDQKIAQETLQEIAKQLEELPRKETAKIALKNSLAIILSSLAECIEFSNLYAPEHLIIATDNARNQVDGIRNAGSVFLGHYSCESAGDYASGTNHTLPTNGYARAYSGVSLDSFVKKVTYQELTPKGIQTIGPAIEVMAEAEGLIAHKNAVSVRLNSLKDV